MKISNSSYPLVEHESQIFNSLLDFDDRHILELGCGKAEFTRLIASEGQARRVVAMEVDEVQHRANLEATRPDNLEFKYGGAEAITLEDESQDIVLMFKSLHHVPMALLDQAINEIHRVLKPGGSLYISEPVFAGEFNEILRLFHDEEQVRQAAFNASKKAVDLGLFELREQVFFSSPVKFDSFADFENQLINVTHTQHQLDKDTLAAVKKRYESFANNGNLSLSAPQRVDLLYRNN